MWSILFNTFILFVYAMGNVMDELTLCCMQGKEYAWQNLTKECHPPLTSAVKSIALCTSTMKLCCEELHLKKADCEHGIDEALHSVPCASANDIVKNCCEQCKAGTADGKAKGIQSCSVSAQGFSDEERLGHDAFLQCCKASNNRCNVKNECQHKCEDNGKIVKCSCRQGYQLMADKKSCEDIDECALGTDFCKRADPDYQCVNIPGRFICQKGHDINENTETTEDLNVDGIETNISVISSDAKTTPLQTSSLYNLTESIISINKLLEGSAEEYDAKMAQYLSEILNISQPHEAVYETEFTKETNTIRIEPTPVQIEKGTQYFTIETTLSPKLPTQNTAMNEKLTICETGFKINEHGACSDIDECMTNLHDCSYLKETCRNTAGSFYCDCASGFQRFEGARECLLISTSTPYSSTKTTTYTISVVTTATYKIPESKTTLPEINNGDIDECASGDRCGYLQTCTNVPNGYICSCPIGYEKVGELECEDIDECALEMNNLLCPESAECVNTEGSYQCECQEGFMLVTTESGEVCEDIDECSNSTYSTLCEHTCLNIEGSYLCSCYDGYQLDSDNQSCVDLDECEDHTLCYGSCVNEPGSYHCTCSYGFTLAEDEINCVDIDECATGEEICGPSQICTNMPGWYLCTCPEGYEQLEDNDCKEIDECSVDSTNLCSENADCINTVGSYLCQCHEGFESAPENDMVCIDVDECSDTSFDVICEHGCQNTWGSYTCTCDIGYELNSGNRTCEDVDECDFENEKLCIGSCVNTAGSYYCTCPSGYTIAEDGTSCIDNNECEIEHNPCRTDYGNDVCLNIRGGFQCFYLNCNPGYILERKDGDFRCQRMQQSCHPSDWNCLQLPSAYSFNFITFVSNLYLPNGKVDLFTMRGPTWPGTSFRFHSEIIAAYSPSHVEVAVENDFLLIQTGNQAVLSLVKSLEGPQQIQLRLTMELQGNGQYLGQAAAILNIIVSQYEF